MSPICVISIIIDAPAVLKSYAQTSVFAITAVLLYQHVIVKKRCKTISAQYTNIIITWQVFLKAN